MFDLALQYQDLRSRELVFLEKYNSAMSRSEREALVPTMISINKRRCDLEKKYKTAIPALPEYDLAAVELINLIMKRRVEHPTEREEDNETVSTHIFKAFLG